MKIFKKKLETKDNLFFKNISDSATKKVVNFYNIKPFPNYKSTDNKATILSKGSKNLLASAFKKKIGYNKNVLEVGCGTGQLSIFFSIGTNNKIYGLDPTYESLKLASNFIQKNNLKNVKLINTDIFDDVLEDNVFDYIWCNGVLHHTKDPKKSFDIMIKSLKKEGYVLLGLYNKIGRLRTKIRKYVYKIFGRRIIIFLDPVLRNLKSDSEDQIDSWIRDQYLHPLESTHSIDEALIWFKENNIEFIKSIPKCEFSSDDDQYDLFKKSKKGNIFSRFFSQFLMLFNHLGDDGGLFILIGKKIN
jgi:ubiquinone/menaquinone biosynthesis C-methylase UbiE